MHAGSLLFARQHPCAAPRPQQLHSYLAGTLQNRLRRPESFLKMQALTQSSFAGVRVAAKPAQRKAAAKAPVVRASAADDVRKAVRAQRCVAARRNAVAGDGRGPGRGVGRRAGRGPGRSASNDLTRFCAGRQGGCRRRPGCRAGDCVAGRRAGQGRAALRGSHPMQNERSVRKTGEGRAEDADQAPEERASPTRGAARGATDIGTG